MIDNGEMNQIFIFLLRSMELVLYDWGMRMLKLWFVLQRCIKSRENIKLVMEYSLKELRQGAKD